MAGLPLLGLLLSAGLAIAPPPTPREGALYRDAPGGMYLLADRWTGRADSHLRGQRLGWFREGADRGFTPITVPSAFNATGRTAKDFRAGVYWYREKFTLPSDPLAHSWRLRFEGVSRRAVVFLNGRYEGAVAGAYLPSEIAAADVRRGTNELVVRVDGRLRRDDLPPGNRLAGWWNYAGLVREVYLRRVAPLDITDMTVRTRQLGASARVMVISAIRNTTRRSLAAPEARLALSPPNARSTATVAPVHFRPAQIGPGGVATARSTVSIAHALRWSPARPSIYGLTLRLRNGETRNADFGIRNWMLTRNGRVMLNGKPITLRGASVHEQVEGRGSALTPFDRAELVNQLAALGADFTRSHYPLHPALLDAFDRLGIVYWEEIPVWRLSGPLLTRPVVRNALGLLRRTIMRDRDHPAVMVWGAENEMLRGGIQERDYLRRARTLTHRLDPGRFLGATTAVSPLSAFGPGLVEADVLGFNDYLGWYSGSVDDVVRQIGAARARYPRQGAFVSEVGAEASRSGAPFEKGTYAFQARFLARQLAVLKHVPGLNGTLVWLLRDYLVRPGWSGGDPHPRPPVGAKGLLHLDGSAKPAYAAVRRSFGPRVSEAGSSR